MLLMDERESSIQESPTVFRKNDLNNELNKVIKLNQ